MPYALFPGGAMILSASSFWNISTIVEIDRLNSIRRKSIGVEIW